MYLTSKQDYSSPDVFETRSPSPSRRNRIIGGTRGGYESSDDDDDLDDDASDFDTNGRRRAESSSQRRTNKKVGGDTEGALDANTDIVHSNLNVQDATRKFHDATGVDGKGVGKCGEQRFCVQYSRCCYRLYHVHPSPAKESRLLPSACSDVRNTHLYAWIGQRVQAGRHCRCWRPLGERYWRQGDTVGSIPTFAVRDGRARGGIEAGTRAA